MQSYYYLGKHSLHCPLLVTLLSITALANHDLTINPDIKQSYKERTVKRMFTQI